MSPSYFATLGVPLVKGRFLESSDSVTAAPAAVLNEAAARRFFADRDPIGAQIRFWGTARTIVGIVGNEKFQGLSGAAPIAVYVSIDQTPSADGAGVLLLRTAGRPTALTTDVRSAFRAQDPELAVFGLEPLEETLGRSVSERRFAMLLVTTFAGVALFLAATGVYGVLSYDVTSRRRELGIRLALGSTRREMLQLVVRHALALTAVAVVVGVAAALSASRLLGALLFGVGARDPVTIAAVAVVLAFVAVAAATVPAWRASRTEPAMVLRAE